MKLDLCGVLCLDKPAGMTSFDAVSAARGLLGAHKAGHAGTLDPMATGVLPVCFGEATKLTQFLVDHEKVYRATLALGAETDTEDAQGEVVARGDFAGVTPEAFAGVARSLVGSIRQQVPAYSAVRVGGERLYERARRGEAVLAPVREVEVRAIEILELEPPRAVVEVTCGRGTYVRALATEIGRRLGCHAHLAALRRLRVGIFGLDRAVPLAEVRPAHAPLWGLREALGDMPELRLSAEEARELGRRGSLPAARAQGLDPGLCAVTGPGGDLVAVLRLSEGRCETMRVFRTPSCIPSRAADEDPAHSIDQDAPIS